MKLTGITIYVQIVYEQKWIKKLSRDSLKLHGEIEKFVH